MQVSLGRRHDEVDARIKAGEAELAAARTMVRRGEENTRQTGLVHDADQRKRQAAVFDAQAELRPLLAAPGDKRTGRRDYVGLAPLAGVSPAAVPPTRPDRRRQAQLEIDRALERRRDWSQKTAINDREQAIAARIEQKRPKPAPGGPRRRQFDAATVRPRDRPAPRRPDPRDPGGGRPSLVEVR